MLENAEEKAPRRVWRAVSARLDSAAVWWRWAVPALVAAALVAGLFLSGTFRNAGERNIDILAEAPAAEELTDGNEAVPETILQDDTQLLAQSVQPAAEGSGNVSGRVRSGRTQKPAAMPQESSSGNAPETPSDITEIVSEPADSETGKPVEDIKTSTDTSAEEEAAENAARWARITQEDIHKRSRINISGLYAQGGVGGNDSNINYGGNGISRMAPGTGSADAGISESSTSTYGVPFTIGLGARFHVNDRLSLGTGLDYSLLTRSFNGSYSGSSSYEGTIFHDVQYLGIPVNAYYNLLNSRDDLFNVYAWGGGEAEYCISNRYRLVNSNTVIPDAAGGFQFSVALGMGFEFKLSDKLGLYLDPAVRYYFHGNQPKSVRTDKPFMFNFDAGLRFNL